jgi:hypothetical protein
MASMASLFLRPLDSLPSSGRQPTLEKTWASVKLVEGMIRKGKLMVEMKLMS